MIKIALGGEHRPKIIECKYTGFCRGMEASVRFNKLSSGVFERRSEV